MTRNDFFDAIGNIDLDIIEHADKVQTKKKKVMKISIIAASLAVLIAVYATVGPMILMQRSTLGGKLIWSDVIDSVAWIFKPLMGTGELKVTGRIDYDYEKPEYGEMNMGGIVYDEIGEKIDETDVHITEIIYQTDETIDHGIFTLHIYEIVGVPREVALAYRYIGNNEDKFFDGKIHYMWNDDYKFEKLSELFRWSDADEHMKYAGTFRTYERSSGIFRNFELSGIYKCGVYPEKERQLFDLLLSLDGEMEHVEVGFSNRDRLKDVGEYVKINASFKSIYWSITFYVMDNGNLMIELSDDIYFTDLGAERAKELISDIKACGVFIENHPEYKDYREPEGEMTATVPEYNATAEETTIPYGAE